MAVAANAATASTDPAPLAAPGPATARMANPSPTASAPSRAGCTPPSGTPPTATQIDSSRGATCVCGRVLPEDPRFCPGCGIQLGADPSSGYFLASIGKAEPPAPVNGDEFIIGKDAGCDLVIPDDEYVSRRHARIRIEADLVFLEDLGSSNGTLLRIRRAIILEVGDEILIGTKALRLEKRA